MKIELQTEEIPKLVKALDLRSCTVHQGRVIIPVDLNGYMGRFIRCQLAVLVFAGAALATFFFFGVAFFASSTFSFSGKNLISVL